MRYDYAANTDTYLVTNDDGLRVGIFSPELMVEAGARWWCEAQARAAQRLTDLRETHRECKLATS